MPVELMLLIVGGWLAYRMLARLEGLLVGSRSVGWCRLVALAGSVHGIPLLTRTRWAVPILLVAVDAALSTPESERLADALHRARGRLRHRRPAPDNVVRLRPR